MRTEDDGGSDGDAVMTSNIQERIRGSGRVQVAILTKASSLEPSVFLTMATTATDPALQQIIQAIQVFSSVPDKKQLADANAWLQNFQHSVRVCCR
jgi:hypothetical protein